MFDNMLSFKTFLKKYEIEFDDFNKATRWAKRMDSKSFVKLGSSYFIDEKEGRELLDKFFKQKIELKRKQAAQARKNFRAKKNSLFKKISENN